MRKKLSKQLKRVLTGPPAAQLSVAFRAFNPSTNELAENRRPAGKAPAGVRHMTPRSRCRGTILAATKQQFRLQQAGY